MHTNNNRHTSSGFSKSNSSTNFFASDNENEKNKNSNNTFKQNTSNEKKNNIIESKQRYLNN